MRLMVHFSINCSAHSRIIGQFELMSASAEGVSLSQIAKQLGIWKASVQSSTSTTAQAPPAANRDRGASATRCDAMEYSMSAARKLKSSVF
jgi:hypothetical protein